MSAARRHQGWHIRRIVSQIRRIYIFADGGPGLNSRPTGGPALPAAAVGDKAVPAARWRPSKSLSTEDGDDEDGDNEKVRQVGGGLAGAYNEDQTWEQLTSLDEDED